MSTKSPVILVTGAAGLIGSNVIRRLNSLGHTHILAVDKLGSSPHKWKTLSSLRFYDYMEWDDFAPNGYERGRSWLDEMDVSVVIHMGARSHTTEQNAAFLMRNNYEASQWMATWCRLREKRFVYASSAATYGADSAMDDCDAYESLSLLRPLNPYAYSKHLFDLWMSRGNAFNGVGRRAVGLKYTNVFGTPEVHKGDQRSLVCKAYDSLRAGQPIELFESANPEISTDQIARDFIHVSDTAKITVWFALDEIGRKASGLFNVGSGKARSFVDLAKATAASFHAIHPDIRIWDTKPNANGNRQMLVAPYITYVPMPENLRGRYQYFTQAPIAKLRKAGYSEDFLSLGEGVRKTVGEMAAGEGN